ncbi:Cytochrome c oxidase subunit 5C [Quillaja saponaria]|uniref:Cytochrome c oxidase subunit 5C n=1 Tax=Quillaja saponaria TaxID=32244 RepID=A0AAD7QA11_QUISA|nr:Cytochrome c oxidase subunit 5C [Quillaja saponaria]
MAGHKIAHATLKGPSVVKEICIAAVLGLAAGSVWKMHHWNEQRKIRAFYDLLEKATALPLLRKFTESLEFGICFVCYEILYPGGVIKFA